MSKLDTITSLPASWRFIPLKELGDWSGGGTPSKAKPQYWQGGRIPWVSPKDMKTERISDSEDHITKDAVSHSTASLISASSVLVVTRSGILRHTLPVAVNSVAVTVNQDLKALTPRTGIMAEYVAWALRAFARDILNTCSKQGTTVNSVETAKLLRFEIPVAPPEQQRTIVAEIEKQFSRLDEAVANLKRVKVNLKRYKASILKAAVEGKLTENWRKEHPEIEPASKLLERILAERREKWEGRGQYKEPSEVAINELSAVTNGWIWTTVDTITITGPQNGLYLPQSLYGVGIPILRIDDFQDGWSRAADELQKVRASQTQVRTYCLDEGDFVINRVNSPTHLGKSLVVRQKHLPALFESNMMRLRLSSHVQNHFVAFYLQSVDGRRRLTKNAKWAVNQASVVRHK